MTNREVRAKVAKMVDAADTLWEGGEYDALEDACELFYEAIGLLRTQLIAVDAALAPLATHTRPPLHAVRCALGAIVGEP